MGVDNFLELLDEVKEMTESELTDLVYAITSRRDYLRTKDLKGFRVGDKVSWSKGQGSSKENYEGEVVKINKKTIGLKEKGRPWVSWKCSPSLLTKIKGEQS